MYGNSHSLFYKCASAPTNIHKSYKRSLRNALAPQQIYKNPTNVIYEMR